MITTRIAFALAFLTVGIAPIYAQSDYVGDVRFYAQQMIFRVQGNSICYVMDERHLRVLGGAGRVQDLPAYKELMQPGDAIKPCTLGDGFFKFRRDSSVYYFRNGDGCRVRSLEQLNAFGGQGRVSEVRRRDLPSFNRRNVEFCAWPDGFYKSKFGQKIFKAQGSEVCHVTGPAQLGGLGGRGRVSEIGDHAELMTGRKDSGSCAWPNGFYQIRGNPAVYFIQNSRVCHVRDPQQLRALGGAGQVQHLPDRANLSPPGSTVAFCG